MTILQRNYREMTFLHRNYRKMTIYGHSPIIPLQNYMVKKVGATA